VNSVENKKAILEALEKAIDDCAIAHNASANEYFDPLPECIKFANTPFAKASIKLELYLEGSEEIKMFCNPTVELTK
jgi:hypothetical protein